MKTNATALLEALNIVGRIVPTNTPVNAFRCVLIRQGRLIATNGDETVRATIDGATDEDEDRLVPFATLADIVRSAPKGSELTLERAKGSLRIAYDGARFDLATYPVEEFPAQDHVATVTTVGPIGAARLAGMLRRTSFAIAKENSRYAISGVLFRYDERIHAGQCVATDGRRLVIAGDSAVGDECPSWILPERAISALTAILAGAGDESCEIRTAGHTVTFDAGHASITLAPVEGTFPPYRDVVPKGDPTTVATLDTEEFAKALKRARILTSEETRGVRFDVDAAGRRFDMSSSDPSAGSAVIAVASDVQGDPLALGVNPTYLIQPALAFGCARIRLAMTAPNKPVTLTSADEDDPFDAVAIIMPTNLPADPVS